MPLLNAEVDSPWKGRVWYIVKNLALESCPPYPWPTACLGQRVPLSGLQSLLATEGPATVDFLVSLCDLEDVFLWGLSKLGLGCVCVVLSMCVCVCWCIGML